MMGEDAAKKSASPALSRGIAVLDLVAASSEPLSLSEIARRLGLPKSSVHGLCDVLCEADLLRLEGRVYQIGAHPLGWGQAFRARSTLVAEFHRLISRDPLLADYTVSLSVRDRDQLTYLASHDAPRPLGMRFTPGSRLPAAFAASGKMMLAAMTADARDALLGHWPAPLTPLSLADRAALEAQLPEWQSLGYAIDREEVRMGMICIGITLPGRGGEGQAGLGLSMTRQEAEIADLPALAAALHRIASPLSLLISG